MDIALKSIGKPIVIKGMLKISTHIEVNWLVLVSKKNEERLGIFRVLY